MKTKGLSARTAMMATGALVVFFTGFIHVWSIFLPYVTKLTGWTESQTSLVFYLANALFVLGNIIGGKLNTIWTERKILGFGCALFAGGVLLASLSLQGPPYLLYITIGVMMAIGEGTAYTIILAAAQKWFPDRRGFASGIIVTANGIYGLFMAPFTRVLVQNGGVKTALLVIGCMIAAAGFLATFFYSVPDPGVEKKTGRGSMQNMAGQNTPGQRVHQNPSEQYTPKEMIATGKFYLILIAMTCGLIPYFLLSPVSQMLQTDAGVAPAVAVFSVMAGSILNACARLILPSIADRVGRIPCILAVFAVAFISMILLVFGKGLLVTAAVVLGYTCFGGVMGNFPSLVSQVFGMEHFSENYGYVMIALVVGSLSSPVISSFLRGAGTGWRGVFAFGAMCSVIAFVCLLALKKSFGKGQKDIRNHGR